MADDKMPPIPPPPPMPTPPPAPGRAAEDNQAVADTIGLVPSLRRRDNMVQAIVVVLGAFLGLLVGFGLKFVKPQVPIVTLAGAGLLIGLVASTLISGFVLMILGLKRAGRG